MTFEKTIHFNEAFENARVLLERRPKTLQSIVLLRDLYGRMSIAVNSDRSTSAQAETAEFEREWAQSLGAFGPSSGHAIVYRDELFAPEDIFDSRHRIRLFLGHAGAGVDFLDRQITGEDWLANSEPQPKPPFRFVFYGVKGGVGRSTALAVAAYHLAQAGKRVLVLDFDLESPGVSSLLLPPDRFPDFGIADWFVEDGVGQGEGILESIVAESPLSPLDSPVGGIRVAPAAGLNENHYISKLSRVYADGRRSSDSGSVPEPFAKRMTRFVSTLEELEKPDVVLIDSRAGLHDLAAISIVRLDAEVLLFATDSPQTWNGYRLLFTHWQNFPSVLPPIRDRLHLVDALIPERGIAEHNSAFLSHAHELFTNTIYEEMLAGDSAEYCDTFNFPMEAEEAPHYPIRIKRNTRFEEFNPISEPDTLGPADIRQAFGDFLDKLERTMEEASNG